MIERILILEGVYRDSVTLMSASQAASGLEGVKSATAVAATRLNLALLEKNRFPPSETGAATPADLVIAVRARDAGAAQAAVEAIETALRGGEQEAGQGRTAPPRSLAAAARRRGDANLAVISVPGDDAAYECATALEAGLNVFCFSSGFDIGIEAALKRRALELGLLLMGPDCGTAIIDGTAIGFANEVERGPVGIVAASGTGAQQISCLLDTAGVGISELIGVGGRDLSREVGGAMSAHAISLIGRDPGTECIVVVGKSPDPGVAAAGEGVGAHHLTGGLVAASGGAAPVSGEVASGTRVQADETAAAPQPNPEHPPHQCGSHRAGAAGGVGSPRGRDG